MFLLMGLVIIVSQANMFADADKIIGGTDAEQGVDALYIVNLKRFGSLMCGGSLLSANWAMSAAHCNTK